MWPRWFQLLIKSVVWRMAFNLHSVSHYICNKIINHVIEKNNFFMQTINRYVNTRWLFFPFWVPVRESNPTRWFLKGNHTWVVNIHKVHQTQAIQWETSTANPNANEDIPQNSVFHQASENTSLFSSFLVHFSVSTFFGWTLGFSLTGWHSP